MSNTVYLVVDTNLFHECRNLDAADFPWSDLGDFDTIELIVPDPVQSELDRQKKDTRPRVKRRAVQAVSWFRAMLRTGTREHVFREQGPRVVMRVTAQTASLDFPQLLDLCVDDDKIVGVAAALAKAAPERDVRLLSDDTRPVAKADAIGLRFEFIPDTWIREPEVDDQEREIARQKAEIAQLQASHPELAVAAVGATDGRLRLSREAFAAPTDAEIASFRAWLSERFGLADIEETFAKAASSPRSGSFGPRANMMHVPPPESAVKRYRDVTYPAWRDACVSRIIDLPTAFNARIPALTATVTLSNSGYRPAEDVKVRFKARGDFLVAPPHDGGYSSKVESLPPLPWPPTGHWLRDGNRVATVNAAYIEPLDTGLPDIGRLRPASLPWDDEFWYYEPQAPDEPVVSFDLMCRRFRHGDEAKQFDVLIFPQSPEAVLRGALEVEVRASNIGRPLTMTFPVEVNSTLSSPASIIEAFLADQEPMGLPFPAKQGFF